MKIGGYQFKFTLRKMVLVINEPLYRYRMAQRIHLEITSIINMMMKPGRD